MKTVPYHCTGLAFDTEEDDDHSNGQELPHKQHYAKRNIAVCFWQIVNVVNLKWKKKTNLQWQGKIIRGNN
jgi:hypothetical protein